MTKPPPTSIFLIICAWGVACVLIAGLVSGQETWSRSDLLFLSGFDFIGAFAWWALVERRGSK